jgi:tetratricopeptide (TPR) repeat protein/TolB-like protein
LGEEVMDELGRYEGVVAVACEDPAAAEDGPVPRFAAEALSDIRFFLGAALRGDGTRTKLTVHLYDAATGAQMWGDSYAPDFERNSAIDVQESIAADVTKAIAGEYGAIARLLFKESRSRPPAELTRYEAMLRYHQYMLVLTPAAAGEAREALIRTTELEPEYGPAWSALGNLHGHVYEFDLAGDESPLESAREYADRGAALAPDSQLARTVAAYMHLLSDEIGAFLFEADAALALNPNSPTYAGAIGYLLVACGEYERGAALLREAVSQNHLHPKWFHDGLYICYFRNGDYDSAWLENEKAGHPVSFWQLALRVAVLGKLGRISEAEAAVVNLLELAPDFESRVPVFLSRAIKPLDVRTDFLDGLRRAGLRIANS